MAKDILMPKLGYDMTEGKLLHWLKHEGDSVKAGEAIFEIETDKVNLEVEASDSGILQHILVHEGEVARARRAMTLMSARSGNSMHAIGVDAYEPFK